LEQAVRRAAIASLLFLCTACSGRAERLVLRAYFDACAVADLTALRNVALVWLHPAEDGVVGQFEVVEIAPDERRPASSAPAAVRLSLSDPLRDFDTGEAVLVARTVRVRAEMHRHGSTFSQELTVTMARAETPGTAGRWIVIRLAPGGRTLTAASSAPR
jgi:hypothetical protein